MADQGYRLVRTGKLSYEFEECKPGQYRYAVDFVGEKSKRNAAEYAAFLEDCGYRVLFKNLNLDYSVFKVVFRPWAKKGGKIAATPGAYNRELLIVEKETDGKPFALHTDEEDIREYRKNIRRLWTFALATLLICAVLVGVSVAATAGMGWESSRSAATFGYVGTAGRHSWTGKYAKMNGTMQKTIRSADGILEIDTTTESGTLTVEIYDTDNNLLFSETDIGTGHFDIAVPERVKIRIIADNHKGSFDIKG